jgi:hypothetical protein
MSVVVGTRLGIVGSQPGLPQRETKDPDIWPKKIISETEAPQPGPPHRKQPLLQRIKKALEPKRKKAAKPSSSTKRSARE